jgi:hypothetical protein
MAVNFVQFKNNPTGNVGSTPTEIFTNSNTCIIDSILFINLTNKQIIISSYLLRPISTTPTQFDMQQIAIPANGSSELFLGSLFMTEPDDAIYAYSDFSGNLFNSFVNYRALTEQ